MPPCGMSAIGSPLLILFLPIAAAQGIASGAAGGAKAIGRGASNLKERIDDYRKTAKKNASATEEARTNLLKAPNNYALHLEYASMMYFAHDSRTAYEHVQFVIGKSEAGQVPRSIAARAYMLRGTVQRLFKNYGHAANDYKTAARLLSEIGDADGSLAGITAADMHCMAGLALIHQVVYTPDSLPPREEINILVDAQSEYQFAIAQSLLQAPRLDLQYNTALASYFIAFRKPNPADVPVAIQTTLKELDGADAIALSFGNQSSALIALRAQCHAVIGDLERANKLKENALAVNPEDPIRNVVLTDMDELRTPPPLLSEKLSEEEDKRTHNYTAVHFSKPTWCDVCGKFVKSPVGKQGHRCSGCNHQAHPDCAARDDSVCERNVRAHPHPHQFTAVHFSTPTWCQHCKGFVSSPIGKQGHKCGVCDFKIHNSCFDAVTSLCWQEQQPAPAPAPAAAGSP